ncbi:MAG: excinuclease ABC subunit UvrC [Chloroflexi bacterium]|jgi:excinuclease ABC subunit C|nr:excinuclease ABC subunit UvrC [Chloroflexota bacterium]MBT3669492.1 excinuclease ABC subunit UvrC [Chloroflexota bacterium]MBT4002429.1 excinuclease ABC subunit UvrC [Chloroflexota bacterium]MBT4304489.1 excinuclease ABC subunit UvrC [Chloroflexota bacterium]MBT4534170.1 excinuclease ABC subunit UvrC [Chloroflexota bacterium]
MIIPENIQEILSTLPTKPGCYLMKDKDGKIIYVGKAINLRARVRSYFHASGQKNHKGEKFTKQIQDIEWIVVGSELEALLLEMNLIKKHRPKYNIRLKDDKRYPYIKVHWKDDFPKVTVTRQMVKDGSRYFGPYLSVWAVHKTLDVLRRIFPYLTCDRTITGGDDRACLYYDIKLCNAPCTGKVGKTDYRQMIQDLCDFLNGHSDPIVARLKIDMKEASENLRFEKAGVIRDQLLAIENVVEKQRVFTNQDVNSDVIAIARNEREACIQIFFIRNGKMIGREYFMMEGVSDNNDQVILTEFIKQFYDQAANLPGEVLLPQEIEEAKIIKQWLTQKRGDQKIEIKIPQRGKKKDLIKMATENANETLNALQTQWETNKHRQTKSLAELQTALELENPPNRIECYDISNTQGTAITASMVVFEQGIPNKKLYRRFNIRTVHGKGDDFASMEEALKRRFKRWLSAQEEPDTPGKKKDLSFSRLPDLLIVDGGKGQLSSAVKAIEEFGLVGKFPITGLAKQNEELFVHGKSKGLILNKKSEGLYLLQRIRDEAHRFAITAHRKRRTKLGLASRLDLIPGIGPSKRKALLKHFGSIDKIKSASVDELADLNEINVNLANNIKSHLD